MTAPAKGLRLKRAFDVTVAALVLLVTWPILLVIAVWVRLDSRGPALFRQERVGLNGAIFRIHKFRSLQVDASGPRVSAMGDRRVTRVGAILRKSKLDEIPQFLDVLLGHMSLVGPRPELPHFVAMWPERDRDLILSVRPGITDPASIAFRDEADVLAASDDPERHYASVLLPRKTAMYVDYVQSRSFAADLRILLQTVRVVVS
ncbi:MAG TPA: sugar transferase [Mycobacteriales bacterium]|nr:sugar transferase [Mycobacteriales bacterium]